MEPNRELFPDHLASISRGEPVGAGSLWSRKRLVNQMESSIHTVHETHFLITLKLPMKQGLQGQARDQRQGDFQITLMSPTLCLACCGCYAKDTPYILQSLQKLTTHVIVSQ